MPIRLILIALTLFFPAVAVATGIAPPLAVPAQPSAPPTTPITGSPPVLDITLPERPDPGTVPKTLPEMPGELPEPPFDPPSGIPDLTGLVALPEAAASVLAHAPPFGAPLPGMGRANIHAVPEPGTALLLAFGLVGIAAVRGRRARRPV